ncbi:transporter substrate-binding domain-containing protein [Janthinobacterium sp. HSC-3S05]|uniref:transporter substrate-binding domain-containing protein n=1 Tax=Janthinobacterium lividum TaxID=29581 RepID=UPI001CD90DA2|nr:transporter substrate-binding domain-containing protein [Janthinobacterium lividum]MCA1859201.1 transporter substrate-binding domain-containing protein [Janthinobacterium lividum]
MRRWRAGIAAFLLAVCCMAAQGEERAYALNAAEQAWVRAHPVLKLGLLQNRPPFEIVQRGATGVGIAADYIKVIQRHSGLDFDIVTLADTDNGLAALREGRVDCLPAVRSIGTPEQVPGISYSLPYLSTAAIAATREQVNLVPMASHSMARPWRCRPRKLVCSVPSCVNATTACASLSVPPCVRRWRCCRKAAPTSPSAARRSYCRG